MRHRSYPFRHSLFHGSRSGITPPHAPRLPQNDVVPYSRPALSSQHSGVTFAESMRHDSDGTAVDACGMQLETELKIRKMQKMEKEATRPASNGSVNGRKAPENETLERRKQDLEVETTVSNGSATPLKTSGSEDTNSTSKTLLAILPIAIICLLFTPFGGPGQPTLFSHLVSTALPLPGPLPPKNLKCKFTLHESIAPIFLLFTALLIPAKTPATRWLVSATFMPPILWLHWEGLSCGTRSTALGFAIGRCSGSVNRVRRVDD